MRKPILSRFLGGASASGVAFSALSVSGLFAPGLVSAQVDEVVVTATRRGETDLQTTPVSISVVGAEEFDRLFATDVGEISQFVPNFSAATVTGFNAASFAMRGAGETDIIVYFDPKVGVLVDDFVVPHVQTQLLEPFDIEAIEVLRGPQGTLFGKNTTSGAVVVRTKRPDMDSPTFDAAIRYGSFNESNTRVAFDIPFANTFAFRFAGIYQKSDGYYKNGKVDTPFLVPEPVEGDGRDLGGKDVFSSRAKLLWQPNDSFSLLAQYEFIRDNSAPTPVINDTLNVEGGQFAPLFGFPGVESGDPLDQAGIHSSAVVGLDGDQSIEVDGIYLNMEWALNDSNTLYANFGRREQQSRLPNEYLGTPYESFFAASRDDDRETTQFEVRLASNSAGPFNYVVGGFYQQNDAAFCVEQQLGLLEFFGTAVPGVLDNQNPLLLCNRQDAEAAAVYADITYDFTDRFTMSIGGRYTDETKDYIAREGIPAVVLFPNGYNEPLDGQDFSIPTPGFDVATDSQSWQEPTYRLMASYAFTDRIFSYASYTRGFKSGGYNDQAGSGGFDAFPVEAYQPEFADSYEIGVKTDLIDDRLRLNLTYFFVTYEDFQRSTVVSIPDTGLQETRTFNAAEVEASGIEAEMTWLITDNFTLRAHLGTVDAKYNEFLLDRNNDGTFEDFSGRDVTRAPEVNGGFDAIYDWQLSGGSNLRFNVNYKHEAENTYYYADDLTQDFDTVLEQRDIWNANITWMSPSNAWYVAAFGKNLTDERYKTASQSVGVLWTFSNYGPPRSYGVEVGFSYR
jgi:iron complex outermembrane receptor protein